MTMKKTTARSCPDCRDLGFVVSCTSGSEHCPDGSLQVQKCDTCEVLPFDDVAAEVAATVLAELLEMHGSASKNFWSQKAKAIAKKCRSRIVRSWARHHIHQSFLLRKMLS